jgi:tripartite-type tricarboxylate transporter receptor subunit TctC
VKILAVAVRQAMDTAQWRKFAEEWYFAPDSHQGPQDFTRWVAGEVATLDALVKEFELRK